VFKKKLLGFRRIYYRDLQIVVRWTKVKERREKIFLYIKCLAMLLKNTFC